jgi:hypothetical protein
MSKNYKKVIITEIKDKKWINNLKDRNMCIKEIIMNMIKMAELEFPLLGKKNNFIITIEIENKD